MADFGRQTLVVAMCFAACAGVPADRAARSAPVVVDGLVDRDLSLTVEDLRRFPKITEGLLLVCPGTFEVRGEWAGASLAEVLKRAGLRSTAARVRLVGADGYAEELPLERATADGVLLAYEVNGHPLGSDEGAPVRLAAREEPGSVWVQHLVRIEVR